MNFKKRLLIFKPLKCLFFFAILLGLDTALATPNPDCFLNSANSGNLVTGLTDCAVSITGSNGTLASANGDPRQLAVLHRDNSGDAEFQQLSEAAARVYYSDDPNHCGPGTRNGLACSNLGRLVRLHTSGNFEEAHPCSGSNCRAYVRTIVQWISSHNDRGGGNCNNIGILNRHYCTAITNAFLGNPACQNGSLESACAQAIQAEFASNEEDCSWANFRDSGQGASIGTCGQGDSGETQDPPGNDEPVVAGDDSGNGGDVSGASTPETPTDEDAENLTNLMETTRENVFGDGFNLDTTSQGGSPLNVPATTAKGPAGTNMDGTGRSGPGGSFMAGQNTAPGANSKLFNRSGGSPGGSKKDGAGGQAAGGRGGLGAGAAGAPLGRGGGGAAAGKKKGRRRGGKSRLSNVADGLGKSSDVRGNMGAAGGARPGADKPQSEMDKKIRDQIARNEANGLDRDALNKAFQDNLANGRVTDRDLMIKASFFPNHSEVYFWLNETSDTLNEQGL